MTLAPVRPSAPVLDAPAGRRADAIRSVGRRFSFALVSDRTGGARPGVFEAGLRAVDLLAPDFAVQLGDQIEGYTTDRHTLASQWDELDAMVAGCATPLVRVPGNHDLANEVQREVWAQRFGPTWFGFRHRDTLFCVLDTQDPPGGLVDQPLPAEWPEPDPGRPADHPSPGGSGPRLDPLLDRAWNGVQPAAVSERQLEELERLLVEHRDVGWTFLCMHMPLWQGPHPAWRRIRAALGARPYTAFAGHVHNYRHTRIGGRSHVRLGTTGGSWVLGTPGSFDHVTQVTVTDQGPVLATIRLDGIHDLDGRPLVLGSAG